MHQFDAKVIEIRFDPVSARTAWISCASEVIPAPGQYISAWAPQDSAVPLASPLFPQQIGKNGFLAAPPIPTTWEPGMQLELHGPLGRGFSLPAATRRLAVAALGVTSARLMPVIDQALQKDIAITLFTAIPLPSISSLVEIFPLQELSEGLAWADLMLLDTPLDELERLRGYLRMKSDDYLPCPVQALIFTAMPCSGLAECSACFVPGRRKWKQACQDGPVFDLNELAW